MFYSFNAFLPIDVYYVLWFYERNLDVNNWYYVKEHNYATRDLSVAKSIRRHHTKVLHWKLDSEHIQTRKTQSYQHEIERLKNEFNYTIV